MSPRPTSLLAPPRWAGWLPADLGVVARRYVVAGAAWAVVAALLALIVLVPLAAGQPVPAAALGPGRLDAAYRWVGLWGMVSLPLAGGLLVLLARPAVGGPGARTAAAAFWLWLGAVILGLFLILANGAAPDAWTAAPAPAQAVLAAGLVAWALAAWQAVAAAERMTIAQVAALLAGVALVAFALVRLLGSAISGSGQAMTLALATRGTLDGWVALAAVAVAATVVVAGLRRPLFGRWSALVGLALWLPVAVLAAAWDSAPELLPGPVTRLVVAATVFLVVPGTLLAVAVVGAWIGREARPVPAGTVFGLASVVALWVAAAVKSSAARALLGEMAYTAWAPEHAVLPPLAIGVLSAGAATYVVLGPVTGRWPRWHLALALAAAAWSLAALWISGLAGAIGGPSAALVTAEARLRLPGALLFALAAGAWWLSTRTTADVGLAAAVSGVLGLRPGAVVGAAVIGLVAALFLVLFIPLADPAAVAWTARTEARLLASSPRADGRGRYIAEGCVACHTQRVRPQGADAAYGPPSWPGDYGDGPALTGMRRAGPDLMWVGDRYGSREAMLTALAVHTADAPLALPWLWPADGSTDAGLAVVDYLVGLRSQPVAAP